MTTDPTRKATTRGRRIVDRSKSKAKCQSMICRQSKTCKSQSTSESAWRSAQSRQSLTSWVSPQASVKLWKTHFCFPVAVLVEALRNSIPLDIDSVLFLDNGKKALGKIFDVIGPVAVPIYCVRFNNHDDIATKGIAVGDKVFYAPRTEYSQFLIISDIMTKGSDASWKNDIEPPDNMVEYSDDEEERKTKRMAKANRAQNNSKGEKREYIRPRHYMMQQPQQPQPNLAFPNYSWHQNLPPHMMHYSQQQLNFPPNPPYPQ